MLGSKEWFLQKYHTKSQSHFKYRFLLQIFFFVCKEGFGVCFLLLLGIFYGFFLNTWYRIAQITWSTYNFYIGKTFLIFSSTSYAVLHLPQKLRWISYSHSALSDHSPSLNIVSATISTSAAIEISTYYTLWISTSSPSFDVFDSEPANTYMHYVKHSEIHSIMYSTQTSTRIISEMRTSLIGQYRSKPLQMWCVQIRKN